MSNMNVLMHNMQAMFSNRQLGITNNRKAKSTEKLSSGYRINRAADDAAGLTISEKMRSQVRGLNQGSKNVQDGISVCQVADGALAEIDEMLHRMTELSIKAANGTNTSQDRGAIQKEINALRGEVDRISKSTEFNTRPLFDGDNIEYLERIGPSRYVSSVAGTYNGPLIPSPSAAKGYISEAYEKNGMFYSSASMDFSYINSKSITELYDKTFSFDCSASCNERFSFTFKDADGSNVDTLSSSTPHNYEIGIKGLTSGAEVVKTLYDFVSANHPSGDSQTGDGIPVSHSNELIKQDDTTLILVGQHSSRNKEDVETYYQSRYTNATNSGAVNFAEISGEIEITIDVPVYEQDKSDYQQIWIQAGPVKDDGLYITIDRMNAEILGLNDVDVTTEKKAKGSIETINNALTKVNNMRTQIGADQNRLEHTYKNVTNTAENTDASESRIRDTDMAEEMVKFSKDAILQQAGQSMLAQANQNRQGILSLLQ